jgi:hypothetical protein
MNPGDTDAAVDGLKSQLPVNGPIRPPNGANNIHSISGGVVAFICLGGYKPNIYVPDYTLYLATITNSCGRYVAGTYRLADHGGGELRYFDAGYMNNYGNYNSAPFVHLFLYTESLLIL